MYKIVTKQVKPSQIDGVYSVLSLAQSMSKAAAKIANASNVSKVEKQLIKTGGVLIAAPWEIALKYMTAPGEAAAKQFVSFCKCNRLTDYNIYIWGLSFNPFMGCFIFVPLRRIGRKYN